MGVAGLSLPLVETLGGPVGVGVAGAVLVVAVAASRVVGEGRGVAVGGPLVETLGGPVDVRVASAVLVVAVAIAVILVPLDVLAAVIGINTVRVGVAAGLSLPLVETLGGPVGVGVAGGVAVASGVVGEGGGVGGGPLAETADAVLINDGVVAVHTDTVLSGDLVVAIDPPDPLVALAGGVPLSQAAKLGLINIGVVTVDEPKF